MESSSWKKVYKIINLIKNNEKIKTGAVFDQSELHKFLKENYNDNDRSSILENLLILVGLTGFTRKESLLTIGFEDIKLIDDTLKVDIENLKRREDTRP